MFRYLALWALVGGSLFAQQSYLELGGIEGDSTAIGHENEIVALGFSYSAKAAANDTTFSGRGYLPPAGISSIAIFKLLDKSTPKLLEACFKGTHIPEATLTLTRGGGVANGGLTDLATVKFKDVIITAIEIEQPKGAVSTPTELVTLQFGEIELCHLSADGSVCVIINIQTQSAR